ncbi:histone-lysine N-methyltransferase SETMAR-like [Melitaea cinxia]|uniref:histone-lysine N-methyltransferase SETMAR-like n=1 Tax=Melitaea cinxia TaxID=113334 RepID=UPI001E274602|nr:histone-lysine N-methyltransferase SETMAR-like [Melitaea cinxia]
MLADNNKLKAIVEADDSQTTVALAAAFEVSTKTILVHLRQISKVKKLEKWVPHELNERQREIRVETCFALLNRHTNEGTFNRIVTCDEKCILFDNRKRSASWLDPGSVPKQCPKRKMTLRK